ncbi:MAG: WYL domain-containing protein [Smithellaceae bacterium]
MTRDKKVQTKLIRLGQILRIFMEKEKVSSAWLAEYFRTTPRTIQRDLLLLKESGFPLHEEKKGTYRLSRDLVKNLEVFDDTELALVVALKNIVGQLGQPFQKAADDVLDRLYECVTTMPVFVKIDDAIPEDIDAVLRGSANIWFSGEKNLEVTVLIDNKVSHYFKRRKMFPTQEIKEERPDGSIIVTFRVGYYEAIRNILKSWIPNIIILEPEELKLSMIEDVQGWLKQQNIAG